MRFARMPVVEIETLGSGYGRIVLEAEPPMEAHPGQFVMIRGDWGEAPLLPRPMSLLCAGRRPEILVKVVGEGTRRLMAMRAGDSLDVLGELGTRFSAPPLEAQPVLVAGGVGVAPLAWLAKGLASRRGSKRPVFLFGARTAADLPLADEIESCADLRVTTEDGSRGTAGLVSELFAGAIRAGAFVYTCGPNAMMAAVAAAAAAVPVRCEASLEAPMACGYGVCFGCVVPRTAGGYLHVCTDGPVVNAEEVSWGAL